MGGLDYFASEISKTSVIGSKCWKQKSWAKAKTKFNQKRSDNNIGKTLLRETMVTPNKSKQKLQEEQLQELQEEQLYILLLPMKDAHKFEGNQRCSN